MMANSKQIAGLAGPAMIAMLVPEFPLAFAIYMIYKEYSRE